MIDFTEWGMCMISDFVLFNIGVTPFYHILDFLSHHSYQTHSNNELSIPLTTNTAALNPSPVLYLCWANATSAGPALIQHWVGSLCESDSACGGELLNSGGVCVRPTRSTGVNSPHPPTPPPTPTQRAQTPVVRGLMYPHPQSVHSLAARGSRTKAHRHLPGCSESPWVHGGYPMTGWSSSNLTLSEQHWVRILVQKKISACFFSVRCYDIS